jgi:hypothetical protein
MKYSIILVLSCLFISGCKFRGYERFNYIVNETQLDSFLSKGLNSDMIGYCYFVRKDTQSNFNNVAFWIGTNSVVKLNLRYNNGYKIKSRSKLNITIAASDLDCIIDTISPHMPSIRNNGKIISRVQFREKKSIRYFTHSSCLEFVNQECSFCRLYLESTRWGNVSR